MRFIQDWAGRQTPGLVLKTSSQVSSINKKIKQLADLHYGNHSFREYFVDANNQDCYSIPLEEVVCENTDRKIIVYASNHKLKEYEQRDGKVYAYEFGWTYFLHEDNNRQIRETIATFLNNSFKNEEDHINKLLSNPTSMALMILNWESTLSDKITSSNIVSLVLFGIDDFMGISIDFISTALSYTGMNLARFCYTMRRFLAAKKSNVEVTDQFKRTSPLS